MSAMRPFGVSRNLASRASGRLSPEPAATMPASATYFLVRRMPSAP